MTTIADPRRAEYRYSVIKCAALASVLAVLTVVPLIPAVGGSTPAGLTLVMACTSAFFGLWLVAMIVRLGERQVIVALAPDGIYDKRIGPHLLPWSAMRQVYVFRARSQTYLAVELIEPERYVDPPTRFDRLSLWANNTVGFPKVSVSLMGLDGSARAVAVALREVLPEGLAGPPRKIGLFTR